MAAEYFSSLQFRPWIRVVETSTVPRSVVSGGMHVPAAEGGVEPIGQRILEMPEDPERTALRDPASGFVAYVPVGSIAKGRELVNAEAGQEERLQQGQRDPRLGAGVRRGNPEYLEATCQADLGWQLDAPASLEDAQLPTPERIVASVRELVD